MKEKIMKALDDVNFISLIAYLILMQDLENKSPNYVLEKLYILATSPSHAINKLDSMNQKKLHDYFKKWGLEEQLKLFHNPDAFMRSDAEEAY